MADITLPVTSKACGKCRQTKEILAFHKNKASVDGHYRLCKECVKEQGAAWRQKNKEKIAVRDKKYREQNKDQHAAYERARRLQERGTIEYTLRQLLVGAKQRASRKGLDFDLTIEWLESMVVPTCPITLQPLDWLREQVTNGAASPNSPSIDRNKPNLGYTQANCAILSHRGNAIKNNGTIDEHRRVVQYMAAQQLRDTEF